MSSTCLLLGTLVVVPQVLIPQALSPRCGNPLVNDATLLERLSYVAQTNKGVSPSSLTQKQLSVGTIDTFWVYNFVSTSPAPFDRVPAELRAMGNSSYVWVSLEELQNGHVDSTVVAEMLAALETRTPPESKDSTKGILQLAREEFGNPPNVDAAFAKGMGDGKTHFLLCDIKDGWPPGDSYVAGFFFRIDVAPSGATTQYSNRRDLLYIDTYPGIFLNNSRDPHRPLSALSHEFQHLIHWNYDPSEITFFNEGLSEYSSYMCGYGLRSPNLYFDNTNVALLGWNSELEDYSRGALWSLYLAEQFGDSFVGNFTRNGQQAGAGFQAAAVESGLSISFAETVRSFHIANVLQKRGFNSAYGYRDTVQVVSKPRFVASSFASYAGGTRTGIFPLAAEYVRLFMPETLRTTVTPTAGSISAIAIERRDENPAVASMPTGSPYVSLFQGATYSETVLLMHNTSSGSAASYNYSSAGTAKEGVALTLINDDGASQSAPNVLFLPGDTAFTAFEGVEGGIIDSISFWFATTGPARLLVRRWNTAYDVNTQLVTGLGGASLMSAGPVSFAVSDTGFMRTVVPLSGLGIRSAPGFLVELIYESGAPHPLLRRDSSQSVLRSYLSLQQQPTSGRTMYSSFGDFYVRVHTSATNEPPQPVPTIPQQFALRQNYPNPFNPSTTIAYELPVRTHVRLSVFDILGREIMILQNGEQLANQYEILFDGSKLVSGVYFIRLSTPEYREIKKMVIIR